MCIYIPLFFCLIIDEEVKATGRHIKDLEKEFSNIIWNSIKDMEENEVEFSHLRISVVNLPGDLKSKLNYFRKEIRENMLAATSVNVIFVYLSDYWDYLNYHLLEHLIDRHASEKVREEMAKYVKNIRIFRRNTKLHIFFKTRDHIPSVDKKFKKMVAEYDMDCATATLEDIEKIRNYYNTELLLSTFSLRFYLATCGSVEITWLVPESLVAHIQKSIKPSSPFMRNHHVTKLTIDGMIVYDNSTGNFGAFTCIYAQIHIHKLNYI